MAIKTIKFQLLFIFSITISGISYSQDNADTNTSNLPQNYLYSSYSGLNADSDIFNDVSLNSFELLSTNIQFSKDNDLQKVVFAPFKLIDLNDSRNKNLNFLYNTKLNLAQKNKISTIGIGFTWDNSTHFSKRGKEIARKMIAPTAAEVNIKVNKEFLTKINGDIKKSEESNSVYEFSNKMASFLKSIIELLEKSPSTALLPDKSKSEFDDEGFTLPDYLYYTDLKKAYQTKSQEILDTELALKYFKALQENSIKITFGGNISLYDVLSGDDIDADNDNLNDTEHSTQQKNISLGITHILNEKYGYSLTGYLLEKRASAEQGNSFVPYYGFSAAFGARTWILNKDYQKTKEYKESLFVPSIHTGFSFEYLKCNGDDNEDCADGILWKYSLTPYIEFKINPKNQFRLGIPFSRLNQLDSEKTVVGPFIQWRLQLSGKS